MNTTADKVNRAATVTRQLSRRSILSRSEDRGSFFRPAKPFVQPRLEVSKPDDPHEREAEQTADHVMRMPDPVVASAAPATPPVTGVPPEKLQRLDEHQEEEHEVQMKRESGAPAIQCSAEPEEHAVAAVPNAASRSAPERRDESPLPSGSAVSRMIQRRSCSLFHSDVVQRAGRGPPARSNTFETQLQQSRGSGQELPANTRSFMENRFQSDFSGVRVHTGAEAQTLSKSIQAQAFTHGGDIYFNSGKYDPDSAGGRTLLAHELTHTIQQGASSPLMPASGAPPTATTVAPTTTSRKIIQCQAAASQLTAAVAKAKGEEGKVNADTPGPDGNRTGWERLVEYFKTSMGPDKIVSGTGGGGYVPGTVSEQVIKVKSQAMGQVANQPPDVQVMRDAMPSWCGIFVFWALNKGGVPMPKWGLGGPAIKPEAAYPPDHTPTTGDIAYRQDHSHYAIVEKTAGGGNDADITTVNGNTAGEDNLGGQVQTHSHKRSNWTGFFNPLVLMEGSLRDVEDPDAKPKSLRDLRRELFQVDRMAETEQESTEAGAESTMVHAKSESAPGGSAADGPEKKLDRSEEHEHDEREIEEPDWTPLHRMIQRQPAVSNAPSHTIAFAPSVSHDARGANQPAGSPVTSSDVEGQTGFSATSSAWQSTRGPPIALQRTGEMVQRSWLGDAWDAVSGFASEAAQWVEEGLDAAKRWLLRKVRDFVREIPGYKMLSFILAEDPITGERVQRNGRNLLYAGFDIMPFGSVFQAVIERIGAVADVSAYLDRRIDDMVSLAAGIGDRFSRFWDSISLSDVGDPEGVLNRVADLFHSIVESIKNFVSNAATDFLDMIKRIMLREIVDFIRSRVPRLYPLLCVALGHDPVTNVDVPRNGTNILNAILEVSEQGREQRQQMQETGTFQKIAGFIDRGIAVFTTAYQQLRAAFSNIWDFININSLLHPIDTFNRIYDQFAAPVRLVTDYIIDVAVEILRVIKEVLMRRLAAYAKTVRGYPLVTVIIGRDPFTGEAVPRNVENVIHGFMSLMDGGEAQFQQMKESGAIAQTAARIDAAVDRLGMTPGSIIQLFVDLWHSFSLNDLIHPIAAFQRILATFGRPIARLIAFVIEIVKIIIEVILRIMNFPIDIISNIINKTVQAFEMIKADPIGFLKNLLRSIKQGFIQFFDNILTHLLNGVTGWLMSELKDAGVPALSDFSLQGVISWVLQVLGISMEKIWEKLAAHPRIGPARVAQIRSMINRLEGIWTFIKDVQERGMAAIWDKIQEQLTNLWDTVLDAVKNWIMEKIVNAVVTKLLSMLDPTGIMAVINSAIAIYRAVQSFIRYLTQMLQVVNSFVEGVVEIAGGNITRAADALENAMDRAMPVVIGFLANQVGLGGVGEKIGEMIERVREMVDNALTWLVNKAVDTGFAMFDRLVSLGKSAVAALTDWWKGKKEFTGGDSKQHKLYFEGNGDGSVLTIRSEPKPYTVFLTEYEGQLGAEGQTKVSTPQGEKTKSEVIAMAKEIAGKIEEEKKKGVKGDTDEKTKENEAKKAAKIDELLGQLAAVSGPLFGTKKPLDSEIVLPVGANNQGFATGMKAEKIYNTPFVTSKGSSPTSAKNTLFDQIDHRQKGSGSYYIRGHLLNDNVGGPGMWSNMTALSRVGNHQHEEQVESKVKAAFQAGAVINYEVTPTGNQNPVVPTPEDKPKFTKIANIDAAFPTVQSIIAGEAQVCQSLVCKASTMKYEGSGWVPDKEIANTTVTNTVETDFATYELGDNIQPPKINLNTGGVDQLARLDAIGPAKAKAIDDYRKSEAAKTPPNVPPFGSVDDVGKVPGIGPATIAALKADITRVEL